MAGLDELVASAAAAGTPLDRDAVVTQLAADNPQVQALVGLLNGSGDGTVDPAALQALLASRATTPDTADEADETDETVDALDAADAAGTPGVSESAAARDELVDMLEHLWAELQTLRTRNRDLADALGACPRCFGERTRCPRCRGRGRPGGRDVDLTGFESLVLPALARYEAQTGRAASRTA